MPPSAYHYKDSLISNLAYTKFEAIVRCSVGVIQIIDVEPTCLCRVQHRKVPLIFLMIIGMN